MSIETDLYSTLTNDAGVSALVSNRVYPAPAPEGVTFPYCTYQLISGERVTTLPGVGDAKRKRMQVSCHGATYSSAKAVADAVYSAFEGDGYLESEFDLYDSQTQVHTIAVDWSFMAV